ncbi:Extracellular protein [Niallia circulans]|jgi:uncharacterized protein YpuA (DUF1002 family)|uniref:DUF1002 domain-containing protein n=1 Tax=Niallia circulans TaxID=1397 RepID=A0A0J1IP69_NIACI|nr:DUF1002 domain-containing protein [Niallia circulans]KLV27767.1 hypothetical protein ABW02_02365 [Niallia circulans]MCM2980949.1 DUF1002 domain-containing protein [Niallia circulans]MDR4314558.1 DUF1002 domain-containing protein [Niallia circulans]MED3840765.1 DUF1002 domain-containing protein [Niallia circulans]MED4242719.1 DUF1002 domain-containing protein [Niallia circulans]
MKKNKWIWMVLAFLLLIPIPAYADVAVGDMIVTLGENLTAEQKQLLLTEMKAPEDAEIITVSNKEEHQYLGKYISKSLIGTRAISSSAITIGDKGTGIQVTTKNINWVTDEMYINALITAGVKDAKIYITAPIEVSGTAALTGIIKAYEVSTDTVIPEDVKQAANEEMVETANLGEDIGQEEATALMAKVKEQIAEQKPKTVEEIQTIIQDSAKELNISLTDEQLQSLISFFNKLKELNIDWNQVGNQLSEAKDKLTGYLESEEGKGFLAKIKEVFTSIVEAIKSFFS